MNIVTHLISSYMQYSLSLQTTFSSSDETLQTVSHYLLDHYDCLRNDSRLISWPLN